MSEQPGKLVVSQEDLAARCEIWNTLGHDIRLGRALTRYGMSRFNETVDAILAAHHQRAMAQAADERQEMCAKVADGMNYSWDHLWDEETCKAIGAAIRSIGKGGM